MNAQASKPRQLSLDLGHAPGVSRDDLVVGPANAAAVELVDRWPDWPGSIVVVAGPPGSGKTHLASVWTQAADAAWLDASRLGPQELALAERGPVVIDDADRAPIDEAGLFHLINAQRAAGHHLMLTARRFPGAWGLSLPDLSSRLRTATTVEIAEPDDALLEAVLAKLFADRQVEVEPRVIGFVARRIERSLRAAIEAVSRMDHAAMAEGRAIGRGIAATVLAEMDGGQGELPI